VRLDPLQNAGGEAAPSQKEAQGGALQIERKHLLDMIAHAREDAPNEACGILAGRHGRVMRIYRTRNADQSRTSYRLYRDEQYRAFKDIEERGLDIVGIYHSHLSAPAIPSETDIQQAYSSDVSYVLISLADPQDPGIRAFHIAEGGFAEQDLVVI
jgi:proteasome lid subunit RPN8/RPN11